MANVRYRYTFTAPSGKQYIAYSYPELAKALDCPIYMVQYWARAGLPKKMLKQGARFKKEKMSPYKYVYKEDGKVYTGGIQQEIAEQVYMTEANISKLLKDGIKRYDRELYCIDYQKKRVKHAGQPWQEITQEELEALDID